MKENKGAVSVLRAAAPALGAATALSAIVWIGTFFILPPLNGMDEPIIRLIFGLKCICICVLFTLMLGIEAVAHERLFSPAAFDPLAGQESHRLKVNNRYLQNTLEQLMLFIPGLLVLAVYCDDGSQMRAVVAVSLVWCLARIAFWIGYQLGPKHRVAGLVGVAQSMMVLLYVCARFGYEVAGWPGAITSIMLYTCAEIILVRLVKRQPLP